MADTMRDELIAYWGAFYGHAYREPHTKSAARAIKKVNEICQAGTLGIEYRRLFEPGGSQWPMT